MKEQCKKSKIKKILNKFDIRLLVWAFAEVLYCYCRNNANHGFHSKQRINKGSKGSKKIAVEKSLRIPINFYKE